MQGEAKGPDDEDLVEDHAHAPNVMRTVSAQTLDRAVRLFKALGDEARLRTLGMLVDGEACVTELAEAERASVSTVSHRLRLLRSEGLVRKRREGRHIYYALADRHVIEMVHNALEHVSEAHDHDADE